MAMSPQQSGNILPTVEASNSPPKANENDDDSGMSVSGSPSSSCSSASDAEPSPLLSSRRETPEINDRHIKMNAQISDTKSKSQSLANFIVASTLDTKNVKANDDIEATLLRCTNALVSKHEILFNGMMRKLNVTNETAYTTFINVVNQLFEFQPPQQINIAVTWNRIIALYAFGGQLALYCRNKNLRILEDLISKFVGRYAKENLTSYIVEQGGWRTICTEFPPDDDIENKVWKVLTWTALGLGIATAASFLVSNH